MKQRNLLLTLILVAAVVFASVFPVSAIGFVAEDKYEAVFVIRSGNALGSGFSLGSNCIITNAHVIDNRQNVKILCYDGTEYAAYVWGMDADQDIAVLMVPDVTFPILEVAQADSIQTGADVYAIGAPKSMAYTLTKGVISARERQLGGYTYVQTDAPINEGNSGGPLLNDAGQVVGMNTMKMTDSEGIGLAIPIDRICAYVEQLQIGLDDSGNVTGSLEQPPEATAPETEAPSPQVTADPGYARQAAIATIVATLSVALNVVLLAVLLLQKRKKTPNPPVPPPTDPRERTDFDIEILE